MVYSHINVCFCCIYVIGPGLGIMPSLSALAGLPSLDPRTSLPTGSGPPSRAPIGRLPAVLSLLSSLSLPTASSLPFPRTGSEALNSLAGANLLNLLPVAASRTPLPTAGVYIGEGPPPVPLKLAAKILRWECVQMSETLPEFWSSSKEDDKL